MSRPRTIDRIQTALIEGRPIEAVTIVDGWITSFMPPPAEVLVDLSDLLCKHQQWTCAVRVLAKASEGASPPTGLLPKVAQAQWIAGDTAAAITTLRRALTLAPEHPGLWTQLGMVLITAGHCLDAFMVYATAHSLQSDNRIAIVGRACAFRLLSGQRVITVKHGNIQARFALSGRSITVDFMHMASRFYEEDELGHLARLVARGGVIADVGANLGNHAVYFLHALAPAEIHLFEPNPACVAVLKENLSLNPTPARVQLHEKGVGETPGELFFVPHDDLNNSLVVNPETTNRKSVQIITLDDTLTKVNFLKIDVEGMELGVLAGAKRLIRECRPVIFIEVQNHNQAGFEAFLKESSYKTAHAFKGGDYTNIIAVPA